MNRTVALLETLKPLHLILCDSGLKNKPLLLQQKDSRKENQCHLISFYISRLYLFATGIANKQKRKKKELTAFSNDL